MATSVGADAEFSARAASSRPSAPSQAAMAIAAHKASRTSSESGNFVFTCEENQSGGRQTSERLLHTPRLFRGQITRGGGGSVTTVLGNSSRSSG